MYSILIEYPNCFKKEITQEAQLVLSRLAILELRTQCNNSETEVNKSFQYLQLLTKTLMLKDTYWSHSK